MPDRRCWWCGERATQARSLDPDLPPIWTCGVGHHGLVMASLDRKEIARQQPAAGREVADLLAHHREEPKP